MINFEEYLKDIVAAVYTVAGGAFKRVDITDNLIVYKAGNVIRIDIKENKDDKR